jgi:monofunctional biosynthetic peptidoglycan transglycosylase
MDGVTYRATFATKSGEWATVKVPFTAFEPTFRGRILSRVESMDTSRLQQIAFMVADKKEGPFQLEIDWVKATAKEKLVS